MNWAIGVASTAGIAVLIVLTARLIAYRAASSGDCSFEKIDGFSLARYEPMIRLLAEDDLEFLASQPGYRPEIGKKLRRSHRRIFRLYLRELAADFHGLHAAARQIAAEAPAEHSELVGLLMRQQLHFWRAMIAVELRLLLPGMGVDVRGLVSAMEAMRLDLARVAQPA